MAAALVQDFFPSVSGFILSRPLLARLWYLAFPLTSQQACLPPQISLPVFYDRLFTLKWPYSSLCCLLGIIIGCTHGMGLLCQWVKTDGKRGDFTWALAFLWYGVMSIGGLFYHCIVRRKVFYVMDMVSTACASISIVAGCWVSTSAVAAADDREGRWQKGMIFTYVVTAALGIQGPQIVKEMLYLVPAAVAFMYGIWICVTHLNVQASSALLMWLALGAISSVVGLGGIVVDQWLCLYVGADFGMLFCFFLGCDLAMVALFRIATFHVVKADKAS